MLIKSVGTPLTKKLELRPSVMGLLESTCAAGLGETIKVLIIKPVIINMHSICNGTVKKKRFTYAVFICEIRSVYELFFFLCRNR